LHLLDDGDLSLFKLRAHARQIAVRQDELRLIVVDYLQLMHGGRQDSRVQEVSDISSGLKSIAKELDVPVLALSQLSRESERRENKRPQLSDLRDSGCLVGSAPVFLPATGGSRPISELVGSSGFEILAINEATWKMERQRVARVFPTGRREVFELRTRLGRRIRATANHQFLAFEGWRRLDELVEDQHVALPRLLPASVSQTLPDAKLALLGHLIGDGCTLPRHVLQYTSADRELADVVASLSTEAFGSQIVPRIKRERGWYQVYLSSATRLTHGKRNAVAAWLDGLGVFGLRSYEKRVPRTVFEQPVDQVALFLRHLWATDGCVHLGDSPGAIPRIYYASSSEQLALDVQSLLLRLSITARVRTASAPHRGRPHFHTVLTGLNDVRIFLDQIGALRPSAVLQAERIRRRMASRVPNTNRDVIPRGAWARYATPARLALGLSQRGLASAMGLAYNGTAVRRTNLSRDRAAQLAAVIAAPELTALAESDVYWDQIASITPVGEEDVFDLTVDSDLHNFVAGDIIVHNSIEQDADVVLFLYREGLHNREVDRAKTDLIVAKNRNGPVDDLKLVFIDSQTAFREPYMDSD
ncbi:MAG: replicative DNA helicase, partial [Nocardiopsaceae bacterium]|nr:replicative DNA helicase [Nocardiopsaceae bacterium]